MRYSKEMERPRLAELLLGGEERDARVAACESSRQWTYGELRRQAGQVAGTLVALDMAAGDRVVVLMPDGLDAMASLIGVWWAGGVAVPLSELATPIDLRDTVRDASPRIALVHASLEPSLDQVRAETPSLEKIVVAGGARTGELSYEDLVHNADPVPVSPRSGDDAALVLYTQGSRNGPKGIVHTHASIAGSVDALARVYFQMDQDDRVLATHKLTGGIGMGTGLVYPLASGAQVILVPVQPRTDVILEAIGRHQPTFLFATPSLFGHLCDDATDGSGPETFQSLRTVVAGGEALPPELEARVRDRLGLHLGSGYGLTETFGFVLMNRADGPWPGSMGRVIPGYEARVTGEAGHTVDDEEIGMLEIRGPSLCAGILNDADATGTAIRDGWLRTSDRVFRDRDAYYFYCSRADDQFKVSGKWVSPQEVEQALLAHEAVWECAVVGVRDEHGLTKPFAYVVPNVGHEPSPKLAQGLMELVKNELAPFKYPRWVEFVDELPKGPAGTVLRYKLRP